MKKQTIIKIIVSILIFIVIMCLEIFGLKTLKDTDILICDTNQRIDIKEEMKLITGSLPEVGTYSVKVVTRNNDEINMYYMYNGQLAYYNGPVGSSHADSNLSEFLSTQAIDGELIFNIILISTAILLIIFITYAFASKNPIKGFIKIGYFILTILVFVFLLCTVPMLSKNHGEDIYANTIVVGSFLIGLLYGWKNKFFFLPTLLMLPLYFVATWFNYRNGMLWPDDFGGYVLLNFFGALTGRIIGKNKGIKKKHFIVYIIFAILLFIGCFAVKIKPRTITSFITDICNWGLIGIVFSAITYFVYTAIKKISVNIRNNKRENTNSLNKETNKIHLNDEDNLENTDNPTGSEIEILKVNSEDDKKIELKNNHKNSQIIKYEVVELFIVIVLIVLTLGVNAYYLKPKNYIESNLQNYSQKLEEQYAYRIVQSKVYITSDYGENWKEVPASFSNVYDTNNNFSDRSYCVSENKIIFTTSEGNYISLIYSDDDGASWQNGMITDTSGYIIYMNFFDKNNGIAMVCYGNELGQREHIRASVTHDGGKTWTTRKADSSSVRINRGAEIEFTSMQDGTIENISYDGSKTVYKTEDGGISWKYDE